jgi:hypothetical protein
MSSDMKGADSMTAPGSLLRWNWALAAAAIVLLGMIYMPPPAIGQARSQAQAISAVGPTEVVSITSDRLVLAAARKPLVVELAGKKIVVTDSNEVRIPLTAVSPGMNVTVVHKGQEVTITVVPKREVKNDKAL